MVGLGIAFGTMRRDRCGDRDGDTRLGTMRRDTCDRSDREVCEKERKVVFDILCVLDRERCDIDVMYS